MTDNKLRFWRECLFAGDIYMISITYRHRADGVAAEAALAAAKK